MTNCERLCFIVNLSHLPFFTTEIIKRKTRRAWSLFIPSFILHFPPFTIKGTKGRRKAAIILNAVKNPEALRSKSLIIKNTKVNCKIRRRTQDDKLRAIVFYCQPVPSSIFYHRGHKEKNTKSMEPFHSIIHFTFSTLYDKGH